VAVEHPFGCRVAHDPALEVLVLGELEQARAAIGPGLAEIDAAHDPIDLKRGVDFIVALGMLDEPHHARRKGALAVRVDAGRRQAPPGGAAVVASIDVDRRGAGKDAAGISGIDEKGPDFLARVGEGGPAEGGAAVGAAPDAVIGAGKDRLRIRRVDEDGEGLDGAQHVLPVAARGAAAENPDAACVIRLPEIAGNADIDVRLLGHDGAPAQFFLTSGHSLSASGRKASSPEISASSL
jgi:hypothetical protein